MNSLRFVFQGDSITDANRGRTEDPNHIMGHSYAFSVASRLAADFPERNFVFFNRGVGGDSHVEMEKRWQTDTLDLKPDVLSVLMGTNDVRGACGAVTSWDPVPRFEPEQQIDVYESSMRRMLAAAKQQNPELILVLGIPFRFPSKQLSESDQLKVGKAIREREEVVRKLAKEFDAVIAEFRTALEKAIARNNDSFYWSWDGVHVTIAGHEVMAREWMRAASERLDFLKEYRYR